MPARYTDSCSKPNCPRPFKAKGLCAYHYQKARLESLDIERCTAKDCDRPQVANKLCMAHDRRRNKGQSIDTPIRPYGLGPVERILANTVRTEAGCLVFMGSATDNRGQLQGRAAINGRPRLVHRIIYEAAHGPLPPKVQVHHGCVNPICVALEHLMPATPKLHKHLHRMIRDGATIEQQRAVAAAYFAEHPALLTSHGPMPSSSSLP